MGKKIHEIDAYIEESADFAQPILIHFRELVHKVCPKVEEKIKWGFPHFDYKGMMCSMAAFKQHCGMTFWKGVLMSDPEGLMVGVGETAMGQFGRIASLSDLPPDPVLKAYLLEAMKLNDQGVKVPADKKPSSTKNLRIPDYFMEALKENKAALQTFEQFSPSNKKEYVDWVTEAKTDTTRAKRLVTSVDWMAQGKIRNWKYVKK